jgi:hypothetical protein
MNEEKPKINVEKTTPLIEEDTKPIIDISDEEYSWYLKGVENGKKIKNKVLTNNVEIETEELFRELEKYFQKDYLDKHSDLVIKIVNILENDN